MSTRERWMLGGPLCPVLFDMFITDADKNTKDKFILSVDDT